VDKRDTIVNAACAMLGSVGIARLTVGMVAKEAGVSTALVHYHFATKRKLLAAAAETLARQRTESRVAALAPGLGLSSLDALWGALVDEHAEAERAAPDLILLAREDREVRTALRRERQREQGLLAAALPRLFGSLGTLPSIPFEDLAATVCTFLDGATASLLAGTPTDDVRASYDAFCLALVALGQSVPVRESGRAAPVA
jgi:AcrR family transcriptional regulator